MPLLKPDLPDDFPKVAFVGKDHRIVMDLCRICRHKTIVVEQRSQDARGEDRWEPISENEPNYRALLVINHFLSQRIDNFASTQVEALANFIMSEIPGEPSQSESAVDTAIRLLRQALKIEGLFKQVVVKREPEPSWYDHSEHLRSSHE